MEDSVHKKGYYLAISLLFNRRSFPWHLRHFFALIGFKAPQRRHTLFSNK
jgi:hypothetical protein